MIDVIVKTTDFEIAVAWVTENLMSITKNDLLRLYAFLKLQMGCAMNQTTDNPLSVRLKSTPLCRSLICRVIEQKKSMWGWSINSNMRISPVVWRFAARFG